MSIQNNLIEMSKSLKKLEQSGIYDVEKYSYALLHQTSQLEYFYCHLVKDGDCNQTYYHVHKRPHIHQLAYFNIFLKCWISRCRIFFNRCARNNQHLISHIL